MTKKSPYQFSPETIDWIRLRNLTPEDRAEHLEKCGVIEDARKFNEDFNEVNKAKILQKRVKAEIEKTFNWVTDFNHIKAFYNLMWQYPNWDVTKIKLKPNCIEFEVSEWEIIKLSVSDLVWKYIWIISWDMNAFSEAEKFNLYIPKNEEWLKILNLMPWNTTEELSKNLKKLCNLKDWKYITASWVDDIFTDDEPWLWEFYCIDFEKWESSICKGELYARWALKQK